MLSVQPLKSAQGAADYYAAAFNYYAGDAQALRWLGKGSELLGLTGVVEKEQMLALLEGRLPSGQVLQNKKGEHRPGFDMTFSAPKSVSILVGLGADPKLEILHDRAVEKAIQLIEEEFAQARVVIDGKVHYVDTGNLVVAAFRQPSSRANDPALHTHGVTMNITFTDEDGKARSLASDINGNFGVVEQLQQHVTYAGLLYRTEYANLLKEEGYRLRDIGKGLFEIDGVPEALLQEFSTRRADIEAKMEQEGWEGARLASRATLLTRNAKEEHNINVLRADWKSRADNFNFNAEDFIRRHKEQEKSGFLESLKDKLFSRFFEKEDLSALKAKEAVFVAIESIAQQTSVFEVRTLKEAALKHTLSGRTIVPIDAIDKSIDESIKNKTLYQTIDPITNRTVLTTPWALTLETETLARIEANKGLLKPIASIHAVIKTQKEHEAQSKFLLTPSQKNALLHVFTTQDRFNAIQGYAGTGKTTMLQLTGKIVADKGYELRGMAVTSSAVNELRDKAGIRSDVFPIVQQELLNAKDNSLQKTIYIVDEASMLSTIQGHELIKLIEKKGARLFLVGDDDQLSSTKCGRFFGQAQQYGIQTSSMTDIIRQNNELAKNSVTDAIARDLYDSLQKLDEVREFKTHDMRIEEIANRWLMLSHEVRERTLVFAPTHANRHDITQIMREGLKKEGTLTGQEIILKTLKTKPMEEIHHYHTQYYQPGDMLRFNFRLPKCRIQSGDYLTVGCITEKHQKNKTIPLINNEGKTVLLQLKDLPQYRQSRAGLNRPIEFYEQTELSLCMNDKVLITRNNNQSGLVNSSLAFVKSINEKELTLCFEKEGDEKTFSLDANVLKHIDYGYVLTNMKVQGKDKTYALGLIESYNKFGATLRNYYVQISRAISRMTLITDDKTRLLKALENNDDTKKTALDYVSSDTAKSHVKRFENNPYVIPITSIIDKKSIQEQDIIQKQALISEYAIAKEQGKTSVSAKLGYQIVTDVNLRRMAQHQLGVPETDLRSDALKLATIKLLKGLDNAERKKILTVKAYLESCAHTQKTWKSVHNGNVSSFQRATAFNQTIARNALAHQIAEHLEEYKSYLHHFSIGKLNRLGVSQFRIEKGEERAVIRLENLSAHAQKHLVAETVSSFFKEETIEKKGALACLLKTQSKVVHPYLIRLSTQTQRPVDLLWREINQNAKDQENKIFRAGLNSNEQSIFDTIKTYKALNCELAVGLSSNLYRIEKGRDIPKEFEQKQIEVSNLRNKIAAIAHNNTSCNKILQFFKIDPQKLEKQAGNHNKRETVLSFKHSQSNFEQKREAALKIATDIKGHYPFIKELGVNTKLLNTIMRIEARKTFINELNDNQKSDYLRVFDYKVTSRKTTFAWKLFFSDKEQGKTAYQKQLPHAQQLAAKRDSLAFLLKEKPELQHVIEEERLDITKIEQHARQHEARLTTIAQLNQTKEKLLYQLENRLSQMNKSESRMWHTTWQAFNKNLGRIKHEHLLYEHAIESHKISLLTLTESQKTLLSQYEVDASFKKTSVLYKNEALKEVYPNQSVRQMEFLDATSITEALTAKPEETYHAIFGKPKKITSKEMCYSGGLIVSLKGSKAGFWYDFSEGTGGGPIQALMRERGLSFKEALQEGANIGGVSERNYITPVHREKLLNNQIDIEEKNKIISAKSILKGGIPIKGTLAEYYLKEHRGIENPNRLNVLFWPKGAAWQATNENGKLYNKINKIPALLVAAKNDKNEITGVQRVYLDERTGGKNTFMDNAKLSKGKIEGSAGVLQKGVKLGTLYLVEGPETGASIAMANPKSTVLVSFGLANLKNLKPLIKNFHPNEIIIAGDNDSLSKNNTPKITKDALETLKNEWENAKMIIPKNIQGREKTDWNDVHKSQGLINVKHQLGLVTDNQHIHEIANKLSNEKSNNLEKYNDNLIKIQSHLQAHIPSLYSDKENLKSVYNNLNQDLKAPIQSVPVVQKKPLERDLKNIEMEL